MQQVLLHTDPSLGPIGVWSYLDGDLTHYYPQNLNPSIPARARQAMAHRTLDIGVPEWFEYLSHHAAHPDNYQTIEIHDSVPLPSILAEYRRAWHAKAEPV